MDAMFSHLVVYPHHGNHRPEEFAEGAALALRACHGEFGLQLGRPVNGASRIRDDIPLGSRSGRVRVL